MDSSALIAIVAAEPERDDFMSRIAAAEVAYCSTVTLYETGVVLIQKKFGATMERALTLAETLGVQSAPFTHEHMILALDAYRRYGKGLGRRPFLNFGDCISYALAKSLDAPLLYKGDDFAATDILAAR